MAKPTTNGDAARPEFWKAKLAALDPDDLEGRTEVAEAWADEMWPELDKELKLSEATEKALAKHQREKGPRPRR